MILFHEYGEKVLHRLCVILKRMLKGKESQNQFDVALAIVGLLLAEYISPLTLIIEFNKKIVKSSRINTVPDFLPFKKSAACV